MSKSPFLFTPDTIAGKPSWLREQLAPLTRKTLPYAPASGTPHDLDSAPRAVVEPIALDASAQPSPAQAAYPGRVRIRIESRRCGIQCDPDNVAAKYALDCCRYAGLIRDDRKAEIDLEVVETRVPTKAEEGCLIALTPL